MQMYFGKHVHISVGYKAMNGITEPYTMHIFNCDKYL